MDFIPFPNLVNKNINYFFISMNVTLLVIISQVVVQFANNKSTNLYLSSSTFQAPKFYVLRRNVTV